MAPGHSLSVAAGVGFVALSGVAVLGDMVLVSTLRELQREGVPLRRALEIATERRGEPHAPHGYDAAPDHDERNAPASK